MGVILNDFRKTVELELPGYPGSKLTMFQGILVKDLGDVPLIDEKSTVNDIVKVLPKLIKEWNFTDEGGNALPITAENLTLLTVEAIEAIVKQVQLIGKETKKN